MNTNQIQELETIESKLRSLLPEINNQTQKEFLKTAKRNIELLIESLLSNADH